MKVIFIRHGQTNENVAKRHQPEYTPLSIVGRKQAVVAGTQLAELGVTHIVSSPLVRTLQTASLIADKVDLIPSINHALRELVRPTTLTGYKHSDWRSMFFYGWWYLGLNQTGESYKAIRTRIATAKQHIERLPDDAVVVVVSHAVFISLYDTHVFSPRMMGPVGAVRAFIKLKRMKNTGMIEYTVQASAGESTWTHSHDLNLS